MIRAAGRRFRSTAAQLSLRWRMALGVAVAALVILLVIDLTVYRRTDAHLLAALDDSLREEAGEMVPLITSGRPVADLAPLLHDDTGGILLLQAYDGDGRLIGATPSARERDLLAGGPETVTGEPVFTEVEGIGRVRLLAFEATIDGIPYTLVSAVSYGPTADTLTALQRRLAASTAIGALLTGALAYGLAAAALRPVDRMRRGALAIRASSPGVRLPLPASDDEIRRLGETLNHTLDELEVSAARRRRFVAHASHELRTPLTRMRGQLELARQPGRTPAELREALDEVAFDTEELIQLAAALLDLDSFESRPARPAPLEVTAAVEEALRAAPGVGMAATGPAWVAIEQRELQRAVTNLVANALLHGRPPVDVEVTGGEDRVEVTVLDHGPGMAPETESVAFEPFTRGPEAAGRPGAGLGLAIVTAIADRAGGAVSVIRRGGRFGVRLRLPASVAQPTGRREITASGRP